ncbi:MAG: hypothetical protein ACRDDG_07360 [Cetobacterium sp.]
MCTITMYPFCLFPLVAEAEIEDEVDIHISDERENVIKVRSRRTELKRKEKRMRDLGILVFGTGAQQDSLYPGPKIWCYAPVQGHTQVT